MFNLLVLCSLSLGSIFKVSLACELITIADYENYAKQRLSLGSLEYLQRGADKDFTLDRNCDAFSKVKVIPRYLIDVSNRSTNAEVLGKTFKLPIGVSPSGLQKRWHPEGELATIRGKTENFSILSRFIKVTSTVSLVSSKFKVYFERQFIRIYFYKLLQLPMPQIR